MSEGLPLFAMLLMLLPLPPQEPAEPRVLVFSKTAGFRHDSIADGIAAIRRLGQENGFAVEASEDASLFREGSLGSYAAVLFLNTTGDVLDAAEQQGLEAFVRSGKEFIGVHSASDTEYGWPWYGALVGAKEPVRGMSVASAARPKRERERSADSRRGTLRSPKPLAARRRSKATQQPRFEHSARSERIAGAQQDIRRTGS